MAFPYGMLCSLQFREGGNLWWAVCLCRKVLLKLTVSLSLNASAHVADQCRPGRHFDNDMRDPWGGGMRVHRANARACKMVTPLGRTKGHVYTPTFKHLHNALQGISKARVSQRPGPQTVVVPAEGRAHGQAAAAAVQHSLPQFGSLPLVRHVCLWTLTGLWTDLQLRACT